MDRRRVRKETTTMNRLYAVESAPTLTGAIADHRLALKASEIEAFARALAAELGINVNRGETPQTIPAKWITALANDLKAHSGRCVVIPGDHQSPTVHALAHAINAKLNSVGSAVLYTEPVEAAPGDQTAALKRLTDDINAGKVEFLAILGSNPAYTAPADVAFAEALRAGKVPFSFHSGLYFDETAQLCSWHVPGTHFAEEWGDVRAYDGTVSLVQPLITPLYNGVSALEILVAMLSDLGGGYEQVRDHWRAQKPGPNFEQSWEKWLNTGVVPNTAFAPKTVTVKSDLTNLPIASPGKGLELNFRLDPTVLDGRFANNGWLQELPKPLLRTTWDNVVAMSPATAVKLNLASAERPLDAQEKQVKLTFKGREVTGLVWLLPGHPEDSLTVHLGYGRAQAGKVGTDRGFNANLIRPSDALWFGDGLEIAPTGSRGQIATTQYHHQMENRDLIRVADIGVFVEKKGKIGPAGHAPAHEGAEHGAEHASGDHAAEGEHHDEAGHAESGNKKGFKSTMHQEQFLAAEQRHPSLYPGTDFAYDGYKWGMSVDLNTCIGCNACVSACTAENNVPVVGKSQVTRGRAMHWIRIDTYYEGAQPNLPSGTYFQPILCMHCEQAPCEPVCPVAATVHSHEGLNQMVYNRCVGTKYCSNNCPYKVRRFNFYKYTAGRPDFEAGHGYDPPVMHLLTNPNVTLRGRGVMEKCTFCVQRINAARIEAKKQNRKIRDGEIKTACQQACPTQAIVFGDLSDPESRVSRLKTEPHDYTLLDDLNTRPRLTFLAKLRNPNPELA
jgi:molybdopterin-containing oxidoreductase family iron-sulfur binding subunit